MKVIQDYYSLLQPAPQLQFQPILFLPFPYPKNSTLRPFDVWKWVGRDCRRGEKSIGQNDKQGHPQ